MVRLNIFMWKIKFYSHKQYLFDPLFSRNAKQAHKYTTIFFTLFEKKRLTNL